MEIYHFLIKNARFSCVCAFFVVPLSPVLKKPVNVTSFGCKIMRGHNRLT